GLRGGGCGLHLGRCDHPLRAGSRHRAGPGLTMLLAIDTGNTQTVIGLFEDGQLSDHWRIATEASRTSDELALVVPQFLAFHGSSFDAQLSGVVIASGVPSITAALREMTVRYFGFEALVL